MKKFIIAALIGVASIGSVKFASAQVSLNINIGSQPLWGPTGYDHVDYYYLPEMDAYYYVPTGQYIYMVNNNWVWRKSLPARYRNVDLYRTYKVVVNGDKPYLRHNTYVNKYKKYKSAYNRQTLIRDSRDKKYETVRKGPNASRPQNNGNRSERKGNEGKGRGNEGKGRNENH